MTSTSEEKRDAILKAVASHPHGATAKQIADDLGWKPYNASSRMGMMFFQGSLERMNVGGTRTREYRYRIKAPKIVPEPWKPELRIAKRVTRAMQDAD